jgi:hypothetical protein
MPYTLNRSARTGIGTRRRQSVTAVVDGHDCHNRVRISIVGHLVVVVVLVVDSPRPAYFIMVRSRPAIFHCPTRLPPKNSDRSKRRRLTRRRCDVFPKLPGLLETDTLDQLRPMACELSMHDNSICGFLVWFTSRTPSRNKWRISPFCHSTGASAST